MKKLGIAALVLSTIACTQDESPAKVKKPLEIIVPEVKCIKMNEEEHFENYKGSSVNITENYKDGKLVKRYRTISLEGSGYQQEEIDSDGDGNNDFVKVVSGNLTKTLLDSNNNGCADIYTTEERHGDKMIQRMDLDGDGYVDVITKYFYDEGKKLIRKEEDLLANGSTDNIYLCKGNEDSCVRFTGEFL